MSMQTTMCPVATPAEMSTLDALMAEPETAVSDAPLHAPNALALLLLAAAALLSPRTPRDPKHT